MYQQFSAIGHLGGEAQMRYTGSGTPVTAFSLAINRSWTDADGQRHEKTLWVRVSAWRKLAEVAAEYLHTGSKVFVVGELEEARPYTDRDGNLRASIEVRAETIKFLDGRGKGSEVSEQGPRASQAEDVPF